MAAMGVAPPQQVGSIAELPFAERPVLELLALDVDREQPDHDYAGYGWARVSRVTLVDAEGRERIVRDVLVLALHSADDGEAFSDDIELEFELPEQPPVAVLASKFLAAWLPRLPAASAIVLALCNPHDAELVDPISASARSAARPGTSNPGGTCDPGGVRIYAALGDVESWRDTADSGPGIRLVAESWYTLRSHGDRDL